MQSLLYLKQDHITLLNKHESICLEINHVGDVSLTEEINKLFRILSMLIEDRSNKVL